MKKDMLLFYLDVIGFGILGMVLYYFLSGWIGSNYATMICIGYIFFKFRGLEISLDSDHSLIKVISEKLIELYKNL